MRDGTGSTVGIQYGKEPVAKSYNDMSEEEKEEVEKTLFILDHFCGSDELYHELVQVNPAHGQPRLVAVKQCRTALNNHLLEEISSVPGSNLEHREASNSVCAMRLPVETWEMVP